MALATLPSGWVHVWLKPLYLWLLNTLVPAINHLMGASWDSVRLATAAGIAANTYSASAKTITFTSVGSQSVDGVATVLNNRILVKNETAAAEKRNGLYKVTTKGTGSVAEVWTRCDDANASAQFVDGKSVAIGEGTQAATAWYFTTDAPFTLDTDAVTFARQTGVMLLAVAQTVTALKSFAVSCLKQMNAGGTKGHTLASSATGTDRTATFPDADLTVAQAGVASGSSGTGAITGTSAAAATATMGVETLTAPAAKAVAVHAQVDDAGGPVIAGFTSPVVPRNVILTFGAAWAGGAVSVIGTDQDDLASTEIVAANLGGSTVGVRIFKTITSMTFTAGAGGAGHELNIATGDKLGILAPLAIGVEAVNGVQDLGVFDWTSKQRGFTPILLANGARNYTVIVCPTAASHSHGVGTFAGPAHTHVQS